MAYLHYLNDQIDACNKQIEEAEATLIEAEAARKALTDRAWYCPKCKKYYDKNDTTSHTSEVTTTETVFVDAGYGDDDEIANVTRLVTYIECPVCGESKSEGNGIYLRETNRHRRT